MNKASSQIGFVTLEALVSLLVGSILLLSVGSALHHTVFSYLFISKERRLYFEAMQLKSSLQSLLSQYDGHAFAIQPRIHPNGAVTFTDASSNPVMTSAHPPSPESTAITGLELVLADAIKVIPLTFGPGVVSFRGCKKSGGAFTPNLYQGYLGFSMQAAYELDGPVMAESANCYRLNLATSKSMSIMPSDPAKLANLRLIVPILAHYTIYQASTGELRYLSHKGSQNIENQPLSEPLLAKRIKIDAAQVAQLIFLTTSLETEENSIELHTLHNQFKHANYLTYILNWR